MEGSVAVLYLVAIAIIGFLLYSLFNRPQPTVIYNEIPPPVFATHWWGYGWRPWWRRYNGVPGFGPSKPLPPPQMPKPSKPIIIDINKKKI